jgi:dTDP-4-amino-4,6-dideoxygalactose transaminase
LDKSSSCCRSSVRARVRLPDRDAVREALLAKRIETLVHYPRALHQHPAYASLAHAGLHESEALAREVLSLPLSPQLSDAELVQVCVALVEVLR